MKRIHLIPAGVFFLVPVLAGRDLPPASAERYAVLDRHALSAPAAAERSTAALAQYLIRPARSDEEKVRVIFRWIAQNITYDTRSFFTGTARPEGPDNVLASRKAVCDGFSGLFQGLGKAAGLEIVTIGGYAKGYGYTIGDHFRGPANHAWNAVKLAGTWRLLDPTWGSGYMNERGEFVRAFDGHFFLTLPEELIFTHFPENRQWQLLSEPVTLEAFEKMVHVKPAFFRYGLALGSHRSGFIETGGSLSLLLYAPGETALSLQVIRGNAALDPSRWFVQQDGEEKRVEAVFPSAGTYLLRVFAKDGEEPGPYEWALDYRIHALRAAPAPAGFPQVYAGFIDHGCFLESPMQGKLRAGRTYAFSVRIPGAVKASVVAGKTWMDLDASGDRFIGNITAVKGDMQVMAQFHGQENYRGILKYAGY